MSHPNPSHDYENEREEDYDFAPKKKVKTSALHKKLKGPKVTHLKGGAKLESYGKNLKKKFGL